MQLVTRARTAQARRTYIYSDSVPISFRREIEIQHVGKRGKLVIYLSGRAVTALKLSVEMARYIVDRLACRECTNALAYTVGPYCRFSPNDRETYRHRIAFIL